MIQGFNKIAVLFISMLKTTKLSNISEPKRENSNGEIIGFDISDGGSVKITKKSEKSKDQNLFKSQILAKLGKKLLKSGNSPNFDAKKNKPSFLTHKTKATFNCLQLTFTKALIL